MDGFLILLLLAVAAAAVAVVVARRRRQAQQPAPPRSDPFAQAHGNEDLLYGLKVGDVVTYHNSDYLVRGSLRFDEDGYRWAEHLISDDREQHWLSVEDDEGISVALWQRLPLSSVHGTAGAAQVTYENLVFALQEQGEAAFVAEGTTGTAPSGRAAYADYEAGNGSMLSFERFGQTWEVSLGRAVLPRALNVYPTS